MVEVCSAMEAVALKFCEGGGTKQTRGERKGGKGRRRERERNPVRVTRKRKEKERENLGFLSGFKI